MDWKKSTPNHAARAKTNKAPAVLSLFSGKTQAYPVRMAGILSNKLSPRSLSIFCQQWSLLLSSGMTLPESLTSAASGIREKSYRKTVSRMADDIKTGKSLSETIEKVGCFPPLFKEMVGIAEETGGISKILAALSVYYTRQDNLRSEMLQVTLYPIMVLILSIAIIIFLLTQIVPIFTEIIESLSGEVPIFTKMMIGIGDILAKGWVLLIPIGAGLLLLKYLMSKNEKLQEQWGLLKLKLPLVGKFLMDHACMQLTRGLSLLLQGGVNLPEALRACKGIVSNTGLSAAIERICQGVTSGKMLTTCMIETNVFPQELCQMIRVGEETGSLTETLKKASDYFQGNFSRRTKMLTTFLEPIILIFVGLMVLVVMLAMMQPIYEVYECYVNMI